MFSAEFKNHENILWLFSYPQRFNFQINQFFVTYEKHYID